MIDGFFSDLVSEKTALRKYGFDAWPCERQLMMLIADLDVKYSVLFQAIGYYAEKDPRGRWRVYRTEEVH